MKRKTSLKKILKGFFFLLAALLLTRGGCDRTDFRNTCTITCTPATPAVGMPVTCEVTIPPDLEGEIHRAFWISDLEGKISFKENKIMGEDSRFFKEDRTMTFLPARAGVATIKVFMFHYLQTSPQVAGELKVKIMKRK